MSLVRIVTKFFNFTKFLKFSVLRQPANGHHLQNVSRKIVSRKKCNEKAVRDRSDGIFSADTLHFYIS